MTRISNRFNNSRVPLSRIPSSRLSDRGKLYDPSVPVRDFGSGPRWAADVLELDGGYLFQLSRARDNVVAQIYSDDVAASTFRAH
ncbi:MAG: hypothetical protein KAJ18_12735, partial [Candidatus Omnitrophica bacterium]|nr:hypothetical protein [Candidatus Omnitrophota bacterium]